MTKLLQMTVPVVLALLCFIPTVDAPIRTGIHEGILLRECDGGTSWNQVKTGDCPLTPPTQDIEPVVRCTCASRRAVSCSKKPRHSRQKRLKICSRSNIILLLLLLLLLSGDIETNPGPITSMLLHEGINPPSICGRKGGTYHRSSILLNFVPRSWIFILLWQTEVALTGDEVAQKHTMIDNLDMCHAVVECTPAPKAMKDMRKRKLAHHRFQQCYRPGWVTLACIVDLFIVSIIVMLIMIHNQRNQQEWNRNEDACQVTKQYICCAMLHYSKVDENRTMCKPRVFELEEDTARNTHVYLQTAVSIFCHLHVSAVVITMSLLLSGDIEKNPGPLTSGDLKKVLDSLWEARTEWFYIGIQLDMKTSDLKVIKKNHDEAGLCFTEMLTDWLKRMNPPPTWEALVDALKSQTVGYEQLADTIEKTHCKIDPPQITQHPTNQINVIRGSQVTFTVAANTDPKTLTYQWQLDGANLDPPPAGVSGATTNTLTIECVQENNTGVYTCVVSNAPKSITTSSAAKLTLLHPPQITQHPTNQINVVHGSQVTFTVAANTDAKTLTYQWQLDGANLDPPPAGVSGATTNTLTIECVQESNTGVYTCVVSNAPMSTTTSNGAQLTLIDPPQIINSHQQQQYPPLLSRQITAESKEDSPVHVSDTNSSSQEFQSGLQLEHSTTNNDSGASAGSSNILSRHPPFLQLSASEQEELKAMLDDDVREMKRQFSFLVTKTRDSVEERIPVGKYATSILALGAYEPVPEERSQSLLNEHRGEIKKAESISEIFNILSAYWNYLNYEILEDTIELYGTSDDKKRLESYNERLQKFCKRRIFELSLPESSSSSGNTLSSKLKKLAVKLNVCEDITCNELLRIRSRIAKILHVKLATLIIDGVDAGCVQITLLIPEFVAQKIFPLSNKQTSALFRDASVMRLECGDYVFENVSNTSADQIPTSLALEGLEDTAASADQELNDAANFTHEHQCISEEVTDQCISEEVTEESKLELELAQQKDLPFEAGTEPEGGTNPTDKDDWKGISGGYDCKFVDSPLSAFQTDCPICRLILRDPYQATCCGTSFCHTCSQRINTHCPTCRKDNFEVFPNKGLKRSIYQLRVFCTHRRDGCTWEGELGELEHHLNKVIHTAAQSSADIINVSEVDCTQQAAQSSADATDGSNVSCTPLDTYAEKLKSRYRYRSSYIENQWPPQVTECFFNLALIKEENVRKGQVSDEFTRMTITGKLDDILRCKVPIELNEVFKKTDSYQNMTVLMEGCPGSGKTALTLHLCLQWVDRKLFQDYKLVILVRLREPAIHKAKELKEILPRVGMEESAAKEIESSNGKGILFILDGWDELPEGVSGYSTICSIICRETIPECDVVVTSRPTSSASLHNLISSRIEILGFTPGELRDYFIKHLDGNVGQADTLLQKIKENPIVAGTCTLPLNAVILVHIFKCDGGLPSTEHGIFEALIRNCILRHLREREPHLKIKVIDSLSALPAIVQDQYGKLCETAFRGVMEDRIIFKLPEDTNTLGLLQGVECYTSYGTEYFYNFLHLSIQEFLAAQHIATFKPAKQIAEFNKLFSQARFSSTFRYYSAITKLATPGIKKILLKIIKRSTADRPHGIKKMVLRIVKPSAVHGPSHEDKAHLVSLLNCLHEAQEPALYHFLADNLGPKLNLTYITLNPADCLSINFFLRNVADIEVYLSGCSIGDEGIKMLFSQDQVYQLRVLSLYRNQIGDDGARCLSAAMENMVNLQVLDLSENYIENLEPLSSALEKLVNLQELYLQWNKLTDKSVGPLTEMIKTAKCLKELRLHSNKFTWEGKAQLQKAKEERNPDFVKLEKFYV